MKVITCTIRNGRVSSLQKCLQAEVMAASVESLDMWYVTSNQCRIAVQPGLSHHALLYATSAKSLGVWYISVTGVCDMQPVLSHCACGMQPMLSHCMWQCHVTVHVVHNQCRTWCIASAESLCLVACYTQHWLNPTCAGSLHLVCYQF